MKKLLLIASIAISTAIHAQTTQDEYNYCVKGYKLSLEAGTDLKQGYTVQTLVSFSYVGSLSHKFDLLKFVNNKTKKLVAIIVSHKVKEKQFYFCIPSKKSDDEIQQLSFNSFLDNARLQWEEKDYLKAYNKLFFVIHMLDL